MDNGFRLATVENAIKLLRPGCKFRLNNSNFVKWEHDEPAPAWSEIDNMIDMIKKWEQENPEQVDKVFIE